MEDSPEAPLPASSRRLRLARQAGTHGLVWLVAMSLFAAADSWSAVTGLGMASFLGVVTGVVAGVTTSTLIHEWFHYLGAWWSGGVYDISDRRGLFVYDWNFSRSSLRQFFIMSVAGSIGGAFAIVLLWTSVPADTLGRAALRGGVIASFVFAGAIEWPVLRRTRVSGDPLAELAKINQRVLSRSFVLAVIAGVGMVVVLTRI